MQAGESSFGYRLRLLSPACIYPLDPAITAHPRVLGAHTAHLIKDESCFCYGVTSANFVPQELVAFAYWPVIQTALEALPLASTQADW